ncbi:efflux RND transporter periplasmic adaptor subunit [Novosphingobium beihaiensis]|uniref:Efflux RND transporter periplasmic adaptor subunit n=1 Tax=Novosphingobium beihaiensis TaxID=2930389 RepID=A0ABT0BVQ0_9SPHN|nr:efflux RND transporter periplasmic adaptor subunit [Novosphingobium beihaiensis]MCJ2189060.1 efflux RND transporter periplasmic adaptor subunit [Novosphingobium beihaiensis]
MPDTPLSESKAQTGKSMDRRIDKPHRTRRRRWIAGGLCVLAIALLAWRLIPAAGSTDIDADGIETGTVVRAPFADYLPVRAIVAPAVTTFVGVVAGGQVEKLLVQDGAQVAAGQPLATLANPTLKLEVLTRQANITGQLGALSGDELALERNRLDLRNQTATASYDLLKAERELAVRQQLHSKGFLSDAGVKSYQEEAKYQRARLAQMKAGEARESHTASLQAARLADTRKRLASSLAAVEAQLGALTLRAPVAGRLTDFTLQPGQSLKAGEQAGQIDSEGNWKLTADVDEYYLNRVRAGQPGTSSEGLKLAVSKVLPAVTDGHFRIELTFRGKPPKDLNRGQSVDTRVTLGATRKAVIAPAGGWLDSGGGTSVFVLDADGRHARRRAVRTGRRNPEQVEVLSGLKPGERIVLSNTASIKGDILNIR